MAKHLLKMAILNNLLVINPAINLTIVYFHQQTHTRYDLFSLSLSGQFW